MNNIEQNLVADFPIHFAVVQATARHGKIPVLYSRLRMAPAMKAITSILSWSAGTPAKTSKKTKESLP